MPNENFGRVMKERRQELGLSLRELAQRVEVSAAYLSDIERGRRSPPSNHILEKMAQQLSLPQREVLTIAKASKPVIFSPEALPKNEFDLISLLAQRIENGLSETQISEIKSILDANTREKDD